MDDLKADQTFVAVFFEGFGDVGREFGQGLILFRLFRLADPQQLLLLL